MPRTFYDIATVQDVRRGPCPGLNTLANHGFLPHDGQNVTKERMMEAVTWLGLQPLSAWMLVSYVYRTYHNQLLPTEPAMGRVAALDLDWLGVHNLLERDASLTRNDAAVPPYDTTAKQPDAIEALLKEAGDDTHLNVTHVARHRLKRWYISLETNRNFHMGLFNQLGIHADCALLLTVLGQDGRLSVEHARSFLMDERIPADWKPHYPSATQVFKQMWSCRKELNRVAAEEGRGKKETKNELDEKHTEQEVVA
ncbi:Chloroperoxidase [Syncephalastrum racemosum]|uniref:Chloroperoxidase n=1 Tax=Syncephalastrum racemosum TaxID=13706 RepID=A0A1X2H8M7_SYNRA|nr:Chloroperoxidase [Syncephalastrum racemosum]